MGSKKLRLSELIKKKNIEFKRGQINLIEAPTGCGKSYYVQNVLLKKHIMHLNNVLYLTDTRMLKDCIISENANYMIQSNKDMWENCKTYIDFEKIFDEKVSNINKVNVMCYHTLALLIKKYPSIKYLLENKFNLIICDEFHNLSKYGLRFDNTGNLKELIDYLYKLCDKTLIVGLTATPYYLYEYNNSSKLVNLTGKYKKELVKYDETVVEFDNINNYLRRGDIKKYLELTNTKMLIYTELIKNEESICKYLNMIGVTAEYLCNDKKLNDKQKELRDYLIKNKKYPKDLQCLIINNAYECGWNLENENIQDIQMIIVDSKNPTTITQVRGRVRHNIELLCIPEFTNENNEEQKIKFELPCRYLGIKLTKELKEELMFLYATTRKGKKTTWTTFKQDLLFNGYEVITTSHGSFVVNIGNSIQDEIDIKKEVKKMKNNELKEYLNSIVEKRLNKEEQEELINRIDYRIDGHQKRTYTQLNNALKDTFGNEYVIISKKVKIKGKIETRWIVMKND